MTKRWTKAKERWFQMMIHEMQTEDVLYGEYLTIMWGRILYQGRFGLARIEWGYYPAGIQLCTLGHILDWDPYCGWRFT